MPHLARTAFALLALSFAVPPLAGQTAHLEDAPKPLPAAPPDAQARNRREAVHLYVRGLLCQREERLVDAILTFEQSAKLDATAAAVHRALIALYAVLERGPEAFAATEKALELEPDHFLTWFVYARQLRGMAKPREAAAALARGLACPHVKNEPELCQQMYFDLALLRERNGDHAEAVAAFAEAAVLLESLDALADVAHLNRQEIQLRAADLYERLGRSHLQLRQFDKAVDAFRLAQKKYPDGAGRLNYNLAQVFLTQERWADALNYLDNYLRFLPQGTDAYELKITVLGHLKREKEVVPWLVAASARDQYNLGLKMLLARHHRLAKQFAEAEKIYLELLERTPDSATFRGLFGVHRDQGPAGLQRALALIDQRLEQARQKQEQGSAQGALTLVRALTGAIRDDDDLALALLQAALPARPKELQPETLHLLAVVAEHRQRWTEAEAFYRRCLAQPITGPGEPVIQGGFLRLLWRTHKYAEIEQVCRQALKQAKPAPSVLFRTELARALTCLGKLDEALAEVDGALKAAGDLEKPRVRLLRVRLLGQGDRLPQAEKECLDLLKDAILPGDVLELRYLLSGLYGLGRDTARAEEQLELCLKLDPNSATINNDLGYLWADQGKKLPEAEALIRKAIELDRQHKKANVPFAVGAEKEEPDNASFVDSLGWVLFRRGKFAEARQELERATALPDSDDPVIWDHLGDVYEQLQMTTQARTAWERALHFYERDKRRKMDERQRELRRKLKR